jgi:CRISPR system Cascade subunit CasD
VRDYLLLRLQSPFMAFGAPIVDNYGKTMEFPGLSLLTGLLGNALGYNHDNSSALTYLQRSLRYGVRCDYKGKSCTDYQIADLGGWFMRGECAWTTRNKVHLREGASDTGKHQRWRDYHADASYLVGLYLNADETSDLTIELLQKAIQRPRRPLFIGRKSCLPSAPLCLGIKSYHSLYDLFCSEPSTKDAGGAPSEVWLPEAEEHLLEECPYQKVTLYDQRDWVNQIHSGQRTMLHTQLNVEVIC